MGKYALNLRHIFYLAILTVFVIFIIILFMNNHYKTTTVKIDNLNFNVKIADKKNLQEKGLMFVKELKKNEGMLFIYPKTNKVSFWMKNTYIPLDIIFIDENKKIIKIEKANPCYTETCPLYLSNVKIKYVLEIPQQLDNSFLNKKINFEIK